MNFAKIPDKKKEPFTYSIWEKIGMLEMSPPERALLWHLDNLKSCNTLLFGENSQHYFNWDTNDMKKFVKFVVPIILEATA